ncbi:hypothetical protein FK220_016925 [Flavobacteriaceae bacterium TP-CH-4]|uniref:Lipoprotein n=1 Tax=Pelagihabitans pacificus TaxID=2696054 RepID=A0A967EF49_9FLAO|nr:hypothetical protein [Pelagihabitans pacificus]NHF61038.1 hypothetical protein [Pelagihabitans pacificus]
MKKILPIILCVFLLFACDKIDDLTKFDMDYDSSVVIESAANINLPFDVVTPDVETNSESEFAVNDTRKDLIEEIKLKSLRLNITSPDNQDFSFLKSVEIFISAEGLEEVPIAAITEVPEDIGSLLELDTSDRDIKEYIKKDKFNLRLNTVTDEVLTSDCYIDVKSVFFVDAKILGI